MSYISDEIFVGDIVPLKIYVEIDASAATVMELHIEKPDRTTDTWTCTLHPDDNYHFKYTTLITDFDQSGFYTIHAYIETGTIKKLGKPVQVDVKAKYE